MGYYEVIEVRNIKNDFFAENPSFKMAFNKQKNDSI
jgi:hypothetical protein